MFHAVMNPTPSPNARRAHCVEATLQGHFPVQVIGRNGHGCIEKYEGNKPDDELGSADTGGDADPGTAHNGEHLRKYQITQPQLTLEGVFGSNPPGERVGLESWSAL